MALHSDTKKLRDFIASYPRLTVLAGAGCSTGSGIPEYRDDDGNWKHPQPVQFADFLSKSATRKRYWARSLAGWQRIAGARPNNAHVALAALEKAGHVEQLITQNVDNLHRKAGSRNVIDLHGVLDRIRCMSCDEITRRERHQHRLHELNPGWKAEPAAIAPDGDAHLERSDFETFSVPACAACGGVLKPDVVFFGETVPKDRVQRASAALRKSDALLVVGSSLMVFSGFRFARAANEASIPIAIVNRGITRADSIATVKCTTDCEALLPQVARELAA